VDIDFSFGGLAGVNCASPVISHVSGQLTNVQRFTISAHYIVGVAIFTWQRVRASVDGRLSQPQASRKS
jgi:hypothetical protein